MNFKSLTNQFLIVGPRAVLTEHIDPVIFALDAYFKAANLKARVTSGLRDSAGQLRIIQNALAGRGLSGDFHEAWDGINTKMIWEGQEVYSWQPGWSKLLSLGYVVNPPYEAKVLMDYYRPGSEQNRKGSIIGMSPHTKGTAFDVSGGRDEDGVANEAKVIQSAIGKVAGLKGMLIERTNNAIHCDCNPIK